MPGFQERKALSQRQTGTRRRAGYEQTDAASGSDEIRYESRADVLPTRWIYYKLVGLREGLPTENLLLREACLNVTARGADALREVVNQPWSFSNLMGPIAALNQQVEIQGLMAEVLTPVFRRGHPA